MPGLYTLNSVLDASGSSFRISSEGFKSSKENKVIVVECPNGKLEWVPKSSLLAKRDKITAPTNGEIHICARNENEYYKNVSAFDTETQDIVNDNGTDLEVVASGFEPLELMIIRSFNGKEEVLPFDGIQPRSVDSIKSSSDQVNEWENYKTSTLRYAIAESFVSPGEYTYRLMHVRDACNHTRALYGKYNQMDGKINRDSPETAISNGKIIRIKVWARPGVKWTGNSASGIPFKLSHDKARKKIVKLPFSVSGDGPWTLEYKITPLDASNSSDTDSSLAPLPNPEIKRMVIEGDGNGFIDAKKAGVYELVSISDTRCLGGQINSPSVTVLDTKPPQLSIVSNAISSDQCIGEIGAKVELTLVGEAPFFVYYKERLGSSVTEKKVSVPVNKHTLLLTPELAGAYSFEFYRIDDSNYPSGVSINSIVKQTVHPQPSARIIGSAIRRSCLGQNVNLDLQLLGNGPWELVYSIIRPDGVTTTLTKVSTNETTSISIGPFEIPGLHLIDLVEVSDSRRCNRKLQIRTTIIIRETGPSAEFLCPSSGIKSLEGKSSFIPVKVIGEAPIDLNYIWHGNMNEVLKYHISKSDMVGTSFTFNLPANKLGTYELLNVYDYCSGFIGTNSRCSISVEPKPKVWFSSNNLDTHKNPLAPSVCQSKSISSNIAEIKLEGRGPWNVSYMIQHWNSISEFGEANRVSFHKSVVVGQGPSSIKLNTTEPGIYKYTLLQISDQVYKELQNVDEENLRPITLKQVVYPIPVGELVLYSPKGDKINDKGFNRDKSGVGILGNEFKPAPVTLCIPRGSPLSSDSQWKKLYAEHAPKIRIEIKNQPGLMPPYNAWVKLSAINSPTKIIEVNNINPKDNGLDLDLSESLIAQTGRFRLRLHKIVDSNNCVYTNIQPEGKSLEAGVEIEYVEAPNIVPSSQHTNTNANFFNRANLDSTSDDTKNDYEESINDSKTINVCKGDVLAFDIIGYQSWSVHYNYNGRSRKKKQSKSLVFKKLLDSPGEFSITKVCHEIENSCCGNVSNLNYMVHNLPSVKVSNGKSVHQSIRQGEKVEILIEFSGTPPFTFTWQRKSLVDSSGGSSNSGANRIVTGKILETHTVQNHLEHTYTLLTSSEGVFQVTFIQDKYCHYPKSSQKLI
ncbi:Nucleoporin [Smittium culicis]|uniref:Nucleoporin n=1 Tax=Smittium culicis TaxID=133412 RepID=A0A1R1XQ93_9FUNG|nr:Nucleoporin [Smittium culicis]